MANRVFPFAVYATEGGLYTLTTPPTCTVQYAGAAASTITATKRGNGWSVEIDEDQDALLLISGTGIATDGKEILRRQIVAPDNAGIAAIKAKTDNLPAAPAAVADVQVTVPAPVFDGTVTIDPPVALQADERAKLLALAPLTAEETTAAVEAAEIEATADLAPALEAIEGIPAATDVVLTAAHGTGLWGSADTADVWVSDTTTLNEAGELDAEGVALGITTPGATIRAYLTADVARATPLRTARASVSGAWSIPLPAGEAYVLDFSKPGYYDPTEGDSTVTVEVVL